jgi:hypothetical protein
MWKNVIDTDRPQMTVWLMRIAYWIPKATEYATLIASPLQQWKHERASMLRYTFIVCLVTHLILGTNFPLITLFLDILML